MARKINASAFAKQMAEQVIAPDSLIEIEANAEESVWVKVPFNLDEGDEYPSKLAACSTGEEVAKLMLGFHREEDAPTEWDEQWANEQWATWTAAGNDAKLLVNIVGSERAAAEEKAKNFRYRG